jgi:hypothetical protein
LALPSTTPLEMTFSRAFIDAMKRWAPLCGLGYVQGWKAAERSKVYGDEKAIGYLTKYLTGKAPACVPTRDQRAGTDRLSLADTADWRDDGGGAAGGAAVVGSGRSLSDAGLVAGGVRCRGEGARSAAGVDTGTVRRCRGRSPAPAGAASDRGVASLCVFSTPSIASGA